MTEKTQEGPELYEGTLRAEARGADAGQLAAQSKPYAELRKSIRSYGVWMLMSAAGSLLPGFDIGWGAILLLLGFMSFYFYDAVGMLLVYAVAFLLAAVSNLLAIGQSGWGLLGALQIIWALLAYRAYRRHRRTKADFVAGQASQAVSLMELNRRESRMVWLAPAFGAIGALGLCGLFPISIIYYVATSNRPADALYTALGATVMLGVLGIPVGIAAISSGHGPKAAAIAGIVLGTISALVTILGVIIGALGAA